MMFEVDHRFQITLLDEDGTDEVISLSMRVSRTARNAAEFITSFGPGDCTTKYLTIIGNCIWYIDAAQRFGTVISGSVFLDLDTIESALEDCAEYDEEERMVYAKAVELICRDVLHSEIIRGCDDPFSNLPF